MSVNPASPVVRTISPTEAALLMKNRNHQRKVSLRTVARYANDMRTGRWVHSLGNPLSIWIDTNGEWGPAGEMYVLNGQHRLLAMIETNTTLDFLIVHETDKNVFASFDQGLIRTVGTMVSLAIGHENSQAISVMAGMVLNYLEHPKELWSGGVPTKSEIAEWCTKQDRALLNQSVKDYNNLRAQVGELGHWYTALSFLARTQSAHSNRWLEFHEAVMFGEKLDRDDARLVLRNYLVRGQRARGDRWDRQVHMAIGIKAWNAFVTDTPKQTLMFRRDELDKSGMPKLV